MAQAECLPSGLSFPVQKKGVCVVGRGWVGAFFSTLTRSQRGGPRDVLQSCKHNP